MVFSIADHMQSGQVVLRLGLVHISAALDEQLDDVRVAFEAGDEKRRRLSYGLTSDVMKNVAEYRGIVRLEQTLELFEFVVDFRIEAVHAPDGSNEYVVRVFERTIDDEIIIDAVILNGVLGMMADNVVMVSQHVIIVVARLFSVHFFKLCVSLFVF